MRAPARATDQYSAERMETPPFRQALTAHCAPHPELDEGRLNAPYLLAAFRPAEYDSNALNDPEIEILLGDLSIAQDYASYVDNAPIINALIAASPVRNCEGFQTAGRIANDNIEGNLRLAG